MSKDESTWNAPFLRDVLEREGQVNTRSKNDPALQALSSGMTLADLLDNRVGLSEDVRISWVGDGGEFEKQVTFTLLDFRDNVLIMAHALRKLLAPGDCALLIYPPCLDFMVAFFACLYVGAIPVPLAPLNVARRVSKTDLARFNHIIADCDAKVALTHSSYKRLFQLATAKAKLTGGLKIVDIKWKALDMQSGKHARQAAGKVSSDRHQGQDTDVAYLQYTSGSTSQPKGVMVTHLQVKEYLKLQMARIFPNGTARPFAGHSWVPFWHDLGLVSCAISGVLCYDQFVCMSPMTFLKHPLATLDIMSKGGLSIVCMNNFAIEHITKHYRALKEKPSYDFSKITGWYLGGDFVYPASVIRFMEVLLEHGASPRVMASTWGLAENVLGFTKGLATHGKEPIRFLHVDAAALAQRDVVIRQSTLYSRDLKVKDFEPQANPDEIVLVCAGHPMQGAEVRVVDPETGKALPRGRVGELWARSPSTCEGYWKNPEKSTETFQATLPGVPGTWLRSGDLGFVTEDGGVFVTSRMKDVIVVNSENFAAADIETVVEVSHPDIRKGNSVAFAVDQSEVAGPLFDVVDPEHHQHVVVVTEVRHSNDSGNTLANLYNDICKAVCSQVAHVIGVSVNMCVLVQPRVIPKTTSGKKRRSEAKQLLLKGAMKPLYVHRGFCQVPQRERKVTGSGGPSLSAGTSDAAGEEAVTAEDVAARVNAIIDSWSTGAGLSAVDEDADLEEAGVTSILLFELVQAVESAFPGISIPAGELLEAGTFRKLRAYLLDACLIIPDASPSTRRRKKKTRRKDKSSTGSKRHRKGQDQGSKRKDAVSVVGMAVCGPGVTSLDDLWARLLVPLKSAEPRDVRDLPGDYAAPVAGIPELFMKNRDVREAARLVLDALDDGEIKPGDLLGSRSAVYWAGTTPAAIRDQHHQGADGVALLLGWNGARYDVNVACSSVFFAIDAARGALRHSTEVAAVVSIGNGHDEVAPIFSAKGILSAKGECLPFGQGRDGCVPGEFAVALVLANQAGCRHKVHQKVVIAGLSCGYGPYRSNGLIEAPVHAEHMTAAWSEAGITANDVGYIEAHGTGTPFGDLLEGTALNVALDGRAGGPLPLGVHSRTFGHTSCASGGLAIAKAMLSLQMGMCPPSLLDYKLDKHVAKRLEKHDCQLTDTAQEIRASGEGPAYASLHTYAVNCAVGHVVLADK